VSSGWKGPFRGDEQNWGAIPATGATNHPKPGDVYEVPQNLNYSFTGVKRQRTNGQLTLQFAPVKELVTTLDYTYSENKLQTKRNDVSAWFNFGPSTSSWTNGPVAAPLVYTEQIPAGNSDIAMGAGNFATKTDNKSLGFNAQWRATNDLKLEFDAHHSTAESMADSPYGSFNTLGTASFSRGDTSADFSHDFPVLSIAGADFAKAPQQVTGSNFQNRYMLGKIDQAQVKGRLRMLESSNLNFGLGAIKVNNRSAEVNNQLDTWGGATKASDYPSSLWHPATVRGYFDQIDGSGSPNLFNNFYTFNFNEVRDAAAKATGNPGGYIAKTDFVTDQRTKENTKNLYLQFNTDWDTAMPMHTAIGVRYEKTDVTSTALVPAATGISWGSQNEFTVNMGAPTFTTLTGKYHNLLPSVDWDMDVRPDMKVRASYGETIGRPRYDQIAGGQILNTLARVEGGTGSQGNPALKPVKSKNFDLSFEWYYAKQSFASVNAFYKDLENYAGQSQIVQQPFGLHTPVGGAFWNEALANGCATADTTCIRNYIFRNHAGANGVTFKGNDSHRQRHRRHRRPAGRPGRQLPHHLLLEPEEGEPERPGIQRPAHVRQQRLRRVGQLHLRALGPPLRQHLGRRAVRAGGPVELVQRGRHLRERQVERPPRLQLARRVPGLDLRRRRSEPAVCGALRPAGPERRLQHHAEAERAVRSDQPDQRNHAQPRPCQGNGRVRDPDRRALHGGRTLQVLIVFRRS
jgi:TonB-dependent receptor